MSLHIECENGHKLICPDSLAGSSVICPKCGSRVDVSARNIAKGGHAFSEAAIASLSDIRKDATVVTTPAPPAGNAKTDEVAFSCPNGHRLTAPRTLQGQYGECPKCKVKFQVPVVEWQQTTVPGSQSGSSSTPRSKSDAMVPPPTPAEGDEEDISLEDVEEIDEPTDVQPPSVRATVFPVLPHASAEKPLHPSAQLFAKLWKEREHGGLVELHLASGGSLAPDWWSAGYSAQSHGLFARQAEDGTYEIHAVEWSSVERITVRGLEELPGGVFEET